MDELSFDVRFYIDNLDLKIEITHAYLQIGSASIPLEDLKEALERIENIDTNQDL